MTSINEEAIINMVKNKRFLWDTKDSEYKNIGLKTEEFECIGRHFNLTGDEVRRKWRSLRSGFRRELLARSNKKPKPKTKQWKHFNKLLFLRDSENALSDSEFDDHPANNSICVNHSDNVSTEDFSDLLHLHSPCPVSNLTVEPIENGEIKMNLMSNSNDKQDKVCQDVDNTQYSTCKILQPNIQHNPALQPQQFIIVKANGMSDISNLLFVKKSDHQTQQATATITNTTNTITNQITQEEHHPHHLDQQNSIKTIAINPPQPINHRTNELSTNISTNISANSFKNDIQTQAPKTKKRKDDSSSDDDLDANDYFGRMVASLIKEFDQDERKSIRLAILQMITDWSAKKNNQVNK